MTLLFKDRRQKQVIVGKLGPGDSFGECTVLQKQPIACSVVTSSYVHLGLISQHDFNGKYYMIFIGAWCMVLVEENGGKEWW